VLVLCVSRDKDALAMARELAPATRAAIASRAEPLRSLPAEELAGALVRAGVGSVECEPAPLAALARARARARPGEWVVLTGSVYLAGAVRAALLESNAGGAAWR